MPAAIDDRVGDATEREPLDVFEPRPHGAAERVGHRLDRVKPVAAAAIVAVGGCIALTGAMIALGALLVHVLVPGSLGHWDDDVVRWFAARRSATINDLSLVGSWLAETITVVAIGFALAVFLAIKRLWRPFGLLVTSLIVEVTAYGLVTLFIYRHRPFVHELEQRRAFASFPSGHTAASVAFYFSIAVIVTVLTRNRAARAVSLALFVIAPLIVSVSRLSRGMHHPTDVMAGYLMGIGCVVVAVFAVRVAVAAAEARNSRRAATGPTPKTRDEQPRGSARELAALTD